MRASMLARNGGDQCQSDLYCSQDTFTCAPRLGVGGACPLAWPDACPVGEYCDGVDFSGESNEGTCMPLPGAGAPCLDRCPAYSSFSRGHSAMAPS